MPESVELTESEQTALVVALLDPDFDCAHNFGPLFREVERMVAAARREALLEAADLGLTNGYLSILEADWLESLAEPERDEERS
ncbi:MAG: hypothetical protein ACRDTJ_04030 [Pseudonocardiaceae bacterium]